MPEINLGQGHTAEPDTTAAQRKGHTMEDTVARITEAIPTTDHNAETAKDPLLQTTTDYQVEATDKAQPPTVTCTTTRTS